MDNKIYIIIYTYIRLHDVRFTKQLKPLWWCNDSIGSDIRQTLPVIPRSPSTDEVNAYSKSTILWKYTKTRKLNMKM